MLVMYKIKSQSLSMTTAELVQLLELDKTKDIFQSFKDLGYFLPIDSIQSAICHAYPTVYAKVIDSQNDFELNCKSPVWMHNIKNSVRNGITETSIPDMERQFLNLLIERFGSKQFCVKVQ